MDKELVSVNDEISYDQITKSPDSRWKTEGEKTIYVQGGPNDPFAKLIIIRNNNSKIEYTLDSRSELSYEKSDGDVTVRGKVYDRYEQAV